MLQGHVPVSYQRFLRKGNYEIKFARDGFWYRPWWQMIPGGKQGEFVYQWARDYSGGQISQPVAHPEGMMEHIKSGLIKEGPASHQGFFKLENLIGPIVSVPSRRDPETNTLMSVPNTYETEFIVKAKHDGEVPLIDNVNEGRSIVVKAGQKYRYYLSENWPETWFITGPYEYNPAAVDPMAASRRKMTDQEADFVASAISGSVDKAPIADDIIEQEVE